MRAGKASIEKATIALMAPDAPSPSCAWKVNTRQYSLLSTLLGPRKAIQTSLV